MRKATRRQTLKRLGVGASAGIAGLAGCSRTNDGGSGGSGGSDGTGTAGTTVGSTGPMEINLGVFAPQSGAFAPWGPAIKTGTRLAKQDLESDLDVSLSLNFYDTQTDPSAALEAMKRAVTADGIDFAQGGLSSAVCAKIGTWASDNSVSYIGQGASDSLTGSACQPYMYSVYQSNTMMASAAAPDMAEIADKWYLLYADYTWGQTAQKVISKRLKDNGAEVVGKDATPFPNDDYTSYLNNVANSEANGLALVIPGTDATLATKQMMNKGMTDLKLMVHQLEDMVFWGLSKKATSLVDVSPMGWVNSIDAGADFKQRVVEQGEIDPFVRHVMSYTAADQQVRAAVRAGSSKADAIRGELEGHKVDSPVTDIHPGNLTWRACDHQLVQPVYTAQGRAVENMQDEPYKAWFEVLSKFEGSKVARGCSASACDL
ncbi:ABC transporter substrate-binding protein [Halobaculum sp. P14]|uniref:ABC transporter substrate-binding protein n=1 Tax=Halobaculum sp. P14 TaxID=3421638 RepID=UPI003EB90E1A